MSENEQGRWIELRRGNLVGRVCWSDGRWDWARLWVSEKHFSTVNLVAYVKKDFGPIPLEGIHNQRAKKVQVFLESTLEYYKKGTQRRQKRYATAIPILEELCLWGQQNPTNNWFVSS